MKYFLLIYLLVLVYSASDDYYIFAREWPGTLCLNTSCKYLQNFNGSTMNIHGLWYQNGPSLTCQHPFNCLNSTYDETSLSEETKAGLMQQWVGVFNSSTTFHNHQWTKHGTCYEKDVAGVLGRARNLILQSDIYQEKYFSLAVTLNRNFNIIAKFASQGIKPSATTGYTSDSLYQAIGTTKSNSLFTCKNINNKYFLISFYLCLDKGWLVTDCACPLGPDSGEVVCPTTAMVYIPPLIQAGQGEVIIN